MLPVTVRNNTLHFGDGLSMTFQRTLRIPDDGKNYPLPPGLGAFPILKVADYKDRLPKDWIEHGGVFIPMYQREALWISFHARKLEAERRQNRDWQGQRRFRQALESGAEQRREGLHRLPAAALARWHQRG